MAKNASSYQGLSRLSPEQPLWGSMTPLLNVSCGPRIFHPTCVDVNMSLGFWKRKPLESGSNAPEKKLLHWTSWLVLGSDSAPMPARCKIPSSTLTLLGAKASKGHESNTQPSRVNRLGRERSHTRRVGQVGRWRRGQVWQAAPHTRPEDRGCPVVALKLQRLGRKK